MSHTSLPDPLSVNCPTCSASAGTPCVSGPGTFHHGRVHEERFTTAAAGVPNVGLGDIAADRPPSAAGAESPLFPAQSTPVPPFPTAGPRRNPRAFHQYEIALSLYRLVDGHADLDASQRLTFTDWASGLLPQPGADPVPPTHRVAPVDDRIDLDEMYSLCLWASIESFKPAVSADVFRRLGGFPQLLKLFWAQRSLVELLGTFEVVLRTRQLEPLADVVRRLRDEGESVGLGFVKHERENFRATLAYSDGLSSEPPVTLPFVSKLTDVELADHLKRALHSGFRVPFHSAFQAVAKLRAAMGVEAKPSAPGDYEKRQGLEVNLRVADGACVGSADATELWALLDDIDIASDMFKPEKSAFYEYVMGRVRLRFAIMSPEQHAQQLLLVAPSQEEVARRERERLSRRVVRFCLRRAADWRKNKEAAVVELRAREAETIATQVGLYLDAPTEASLSRRKAVRDILAEVCKHARLGTDVESVLSDCTERLLTFFES